MPGQNGAKVRVGDHRGVPDAVNRIQRIPHPDRVQPQPLVFRPHASVNLQMQTLCGSPAREV